MPWLEDFSWSYGPLINLLVDKSSKSCPCSLATTCWMLKIFHGNLLYLRYRCASGSSGGGSGDLSEHLTNVQIVLKFSVLYRQSLFLILTHTAYIANDKSLVVY